MVDTYQIEAALSPWETKIMHNGEPMNNVRRFRVEQSAKEICTLTLELEADLIEIQTNGVNVVRNDRPMPARFHRPRGHDPYNSDDPL